MEQVEKVCKGLQTAVDSDWMWQKADYIAMICKDALALIRQQRERITELEAAQTARVMTVEEVKSAWRNRNIAFLVDYNDGGSPVWMLYYGYLSSLKEILLIDEIAHLHRFGVDGYGVDWRCWTSRPTDEQREAVKWE